jgi:branched-chain amino acid transport system substrate-binding protein
MGVAAVLIITAAGCSGAAQSTTSGSAELAPIKIGLDFDYTGVAAHEGHGAYDGAILAIEDQNAKGGINGHKIIFELGDNQCDTALGMTSLQRLHADGAVVTMGSNCSSVTVALMPIIAQAQIPNLSVIDVAPKITAGAGVGGNKYEFRLDPNNDTLGTALGKQLISKEVKTLAVVVQSTDAGISARTAVVGSLASDVKIVFDDRFTLGQGDYRALLTKMAQTNPEGLFLAGDYPDLSKLINQMHELNIPIPKMYVQGNFVDPAVFPLLGDPSWANGVQEVSQWAPGLPEADFLVKEVQDRLGNETNVDTGMAYFGAQVIFAAMATIKGDITPAAVTDALKAVDVDIAGLGHVAFDDHNQAHVPAFIVAIKDQKTIIVGTISS